MREIATEINTRDVIEIDLGKLIMNYLEKWWLILLCGILAAAVSLGVTRYAITPMYRASVMIYVNNTKAGEKVDVISGSNLSASQQLVNTYINIIESDTVLGKVIEYGELAYTTDDIRDMMTTSQVDDTEIFKVHITHEDPQMAAHIANVMAKVAPGEIEEFVEGSSTKIIDYAKVPDKRSSPSYTVNTVLGGAIGVALALAYVTLRFLLDVRIKDEDDLGHMFDYPILGQVPAFDKIDKRKAEYGRRAYEVKNDNEEGR